MGPIVERGIYFADRTLQGFASVVKFYGYMHGIAEGSDTRLATSAERIAVDYLILEAVGADQRHATSDKEGTACSLGNVFEDKDAWLEILLIHLVGLAVRRDEASGRTVP